MQLRYITCSGANENTPTDKLINLAKQSKLVELGIVANSSNIKKGTPFYDWFDKLLDLSNNTDMNLALHIGGDWCTDLCEGKIPTEIQKWMTVRNKKSNMPAIRRWQLNISNSMNLSKTSALQKIIKDNPDKEFIFSFNRGPIIMEFINKLYKSGEKFSLLYDSSYGMGRHPQYWEGPYYAGREHGYAGGLSSDNVYENLTQISYVVPDTYHTWIDAEYRLKTPGTTRFNLETAQEYVANALKWQKAHTR